MNLTYVVATFVVAVVVDGFIVGKFFVFRPPPQAVMTGVGPECWVGPWGPRTINTRGFDSHAYIYAGLPNGDNNM